MGPTFMCRLFGGRNVGVTLVPDPSSARTVIPAEDDLRDVVYDVWNPNVMGQVITLASLPADLQAKWADAMVNAESTPLAAFGGDNITSCISEILARLPDVRDAIRAALPAAAHDYAHPSN